MARGVLVAQARGAGRIGLNRGTPPPSGGTRPEGWVAATSLLAGDTRAYSGLVSGIT